MTDATLGIIFKVTMYPGFPGTIHLSFCRIVPAIYPTQHFSWNFFIFKESVININIELLVNELGGHSHNTRNFHHDLTQYILIQTHFGYLPRDPGKPVDNTKSDILKVLQMG